MTPNPITYDSRSLYISGKPLRILSGSAHYTRTHPSRWNKLFETFHKASLNTLETYVFWNTHAVSPGSQQYDFSGRKDLFSFIKAAGDSGLHVILRLGPYVCAEANFGGFPSWLRDVEGIRFRAWNEPFLQLVQAWVQYVSRELKGRKLLASNGGPVILIQLENEYSMVSDQYGKQGEKYLQWCADLQASQNFKIPAIMCYGAADGVIETINSFYAHKELADHRKRHPDQPAIWTEMWTGWYDTWGSPHHIRETTDVVYAVARFFAQGGAGVNYYMWFGGTNFGRDPMYCQVTSYGYDAPVDEFYLETTKMRHLTRFHKILKKVFDSGDWTGGEEGAYQWGAYTFECDDEAKRVKVLDAERNCLFDSSKIAEEDMVSRTYQRCECTTTNWTYAEEERPKFSDIPLIGTTGNRKWIQSKGHSEVPEQLLLTKDESDYAWYVTKVNGDGACTLEFDAADYAYVFADGQLVGETESPLWEDRWSNRWNHYDIDRGTQHKIYCKLSGEHELCILTVSMGMVKGDWQLPPGSNMVNEKKGLLSDVNGVRRTAEWRCVGGLSRNPGEQASNDASTPDANGPAWFSCSIFVNKRSDSWVLDFGGAGKGLFWVNGTLLGRFWDIKGTRPMTGFLDGSPIKQIDHGEATQKYYHVPSWVLAADQDQLKLEVVLFVERGAPTRPPSLFEVV